MALGERERVASGLLAQAWREAARDLVVRFESPFAMVLGGRTFWCSGWLRDFGCPRGTIIAGRETVDEIFDVADALHYYSSALNPLYYEHYDRDRFIETLNDWGWFGAPEHAPSWFSGAFGVHGGVSGKP